MGAQFEKLREKLLRLHKLDSRKSAIEEKFQKSLFELEQSLKPIKEIKKIPQNSGIYGIGFVGETFPLPSANNQSDIVRLLYIGKAEDSLKKRTLDQHFKTGETGWSTVRSSIGAILQPELNLIPRPRRGSRRQSKVKHFEFDGGGETQLTEWMTNNLSLGYLRDIPIGMALHEFEDNLKSIATPILNIDSKMSRLNPYFAEIRGLRRKCRELAQTYKNSKIE